MQAKLDQPKLRVDMLNGAKFVKHHKMSTGKLGVTGFCYGGGVTNWLATQLGPDMQAGAPFYGAAPATADIAKIKCPLVINYAENDPRIDEMWPAYEQGLKAAGVKYEMYVYPGTQHGFHNNSTPRYNEAQAKLAWDRTIALFKKSLT
jgi:carboxymethylenebutenolidase